MYLRAVLAVVGLGTAVADSSVAGECLELDPGGPPSPQQRQLAGLLREAERRRKTGHGPDLLLRRGSRD